MLITSEFGIASMRKAAAFMFLSTVACSSMPTPGPSLAGKFTSALGPIALMNPNLVTYPLAQRYQTQNLSSLPLNRSVVTHPSAISHFHFLSSLSFNLSSLHFFLPSFHYSLLTAPLVFSSHFSNFTLFFKLHFLLQTSPYSSNFTFFFKLLFTAINHFDQSPLFFQVSPSNFQYFEIC
jgi:hypothetical protein